MYTYSSFSKFGSGIAVKSNENILRTRLHNICSISEVYAILAVLKYVEEKEDDKYIIFTDPLSVLNCLSN